MSESSLAPRVADTDFTGGQRPRPVAPPGMVVVPPLIEGVDMQALVGKKHLYARMKPLRNGFLVEPIAHLTMQPGGRITGYAHPNEGSWMEYGFGEVDAARAFAFVTASNSWIPSSTWTQSIAGIPVGHFCDEPEAQLAVTRLCLVPATDPVPPDDVVYLVASCRAFYERTVPILLAQLREEGIPDRRIKVVVNGCERASDATIDGVDHAFSTHDAWEWSALYEAPLRWDFGYAFLMHDTNVIFPGFRRSVEGFNRHLPWDHLPASPLARCLLGLYSHGFLMRINDWLRGIDHISKKDGVIAEASAELLLRARCALVMGDPERNGASRAAEWHELIDQFNTGTKRVRRVFPSIRLHKFIHAGPTDPSQL